MSLGWLFRGLSIVAGATHASRGKMIVGIIQNKNKNKTRQDKTGQDQDRTRQDKTRKDKTRQDKTSHAKPRQDKTRQDKTRQDKTRQDKTRQDKTRQDKTRQDKTKRKQNKTGPTVSELASSSVTFPSRGNERTWNKRTKSVGIGLDDFLEMEPSQAMHLYGMKERDVT